jgi:hypothetical protein
MTCVRSGVAALMRRSGLIGWVLAAVLAVPVFVWATTPREAARSVAGTSALDENDGARLRVRLADIHSVNDLADAVGAALHRPVHVHENQIPFATQIHMDFRVSEVDVETAFRLFNAHIELSYSQVWWTVFGDHVEVGERSKMEALRCVSRVYHIAPGPAASAALVSGGDPYLQETRMRRVVDLLQANVRTESWRDNGGELAHHQVLGESLLITAPYDMQREIESVLKDYRGAMMPTFLRQSVASGSTRAGWPSPFRGQERVIASMNQPI